jgi:hypothetical protein
MKNSSDTIWNRIATFQFIAQCLNQLRHRVSPQFLLLYLVIQKQETILCPCHQIGDFRNSNRKCHTLGPYEACLSPSPHVLSTPLKESPRNPRSDLRSVHAGFMLDKVALRQVYLPVPYSLTTLYNLSKGRLL